ncbi:hypothetical protein [Bacillus sp. FJAT-47783]|uniref:hypothetical protein n=1 Tax=Bacillus sp. FJAT-47783 TaxID=2922712 RepID=UPI001FAE7020|nr:hypothetical protein [Bacillus sp. FJAT-47783]
MTRKVITACSIFGIMFGSAWYMHENTKRTYVDNVDTPIISNMIKTDTKTSNPTLTQQIIETDIFERFSPREYIRVMSH